MGCGCAHWTQGKRDKAGGGRSAATEKKCEKDMSLLMQTEDKSGRSTERTQGFRKIRELAERGAQEVDIAPGQFVVENKDNIHTSYTFQKKLGEGRFRANPQAPSASSITLCTTQPRSAAPSNSSRKKTSPSIASPRSSKKSPSSNN